MLKFRPRIFFGLDTKSTPVRINGFDLLFKEVSCLQGAAQKPFSNCCSDTHSHSSTSSPAVFFPQCLLLGSQVPLQAPWGHSHSSAPVCAIFLQVFSGEYGVASPVHPWGLQCACSLTFHRSNKITLWTKSWCPPCLYFLLRT